MKNITARKPNTGTIKIHLPATDAGFPLCKQAKYKGIRKFAITTPPAEFVKLDYFIRCEKCYRMLAKHLSGT